ncbi:hypothetical protein CSP5_0914 [Cuniculiplasma divulgatum]|uniref:Uncharacterized protein n=1 Tax=Cuniculiplasma divulgatum TaxID=1673428 RepID=A0A1N5UDA2_9ARCH|nr:hypothetical protein CSP5_0914 [Cuniculiplasma divulgatum]
MMRDYLEYAKDHEIVNTKVSVYLIKRIGRYPLPKMVYLLLVLYTLNSWYIKQPILSGGSFRIY